MTTARNNFLIHHALLRLQRHTHNNPTEIFKVFWRYPENPQLICQLGLFMDLVCYHIEDCLTLKGHNRVLERLGRDRQTIITVYYYLDHPNLFDTVHLTIPTHLPQSYPWENQISLLPIKTT